MIDITLVDREVDTSRFSPFNESLPSLFLGFAIKNEYDNQRLKICEKYKPRREMFLFEHKDDDEFSLIPLYGLFLPLNEVGKKLASTLLEQDLSSCMDYKLYESILEEYNFTCYNSYSYLNKRIYPIDFQHFDKLTDDEVVKDKKILQHLLELDDHKFDFQQFGSFKLLILV